MCVCLGYISTEVKRPEEEVALTPEPEAEPEAEPDVVDGKRDLEPETQQQQEHTTEEQGEKCPVSSPLPSATADPAPAPAEDNRVGLNPYVVYAVAMSTWWL